MTMTDSYAGRTVTAFFDERDDADEAVEALIDAGVARSDVRLVAGASTGDPDTDHKGFWESLKDFFFPDDDRYAYAEGLRRGGYLVSASNLSADQYTVAVEILDDEGAIDLEERKAAWSDEGWTGYEQAGIDTDGPYAGPRASRTSATDEVIPVVQEDLRVGKRDVDLGRVRVRSYTVEEPVSEDVNLRDEHVVVERRPVNRAVGSTDAFRDRVIEAEEHAEEAVVSKDARVVEEVAIRKEAGEHVETVRDTVRHTEVEVDDQRRPSEPRRFGS